MGIYLLKRFSRPKFTRFFNINEKPCPGKCWIRPESAHAARSGEQNLFMASVRLLRFPVCGPVMLLWRREACLELSLKNANRARTIELTAGLLAVRMMEDCARRIREDAHEPLTEMDNGDRDLMRLPDVSWPSGL